MEVKRGEEERGGCARQRGAMPNVKKGGRWEEERRKKERRKEKERMKKECIKELKRSKKGQRMKAE